MTTRHSRILTSTVSGFAFTVAAVTVAIVLAAFATVPFTPAHVLAKALLAVGAGACAAALLLPITVSVGITTDGVVYRRFGGRVRRIPTECIVLAEAVHVGAGAILGLGIPATVATDRRIVRPGWTLHLRLTNGEEIWLSTRGPLDVNAVLRAAITVPSSSAQQACTSDGRKHDERRQQSR